MPSNINFDANTVAPNTRPDPLPNGEYTAIITESEVAPTANGKGKLLKLEFQVTEGEYKGRKAWAQLCVQHENEQTQKIAQGQLSAICHATGVLKLQNSSQLHGIPLRIRTVVTKSAGYDPKNEIKGYKPLDGGAAPTPAAAAAATPTAAAPTASAVPSWAKKSA